jgi:hypothetical protein
MDSLNNTLLKKQCGHIEKYQSSLIKDTIFIIKEKREKKQDYLKRPSSMLEGCTTSTGDSQRLQPLVVFCHPS